MEGGKNWRSGEFSPLGAEYAEMMEEALSTLLAREERLKEKKAKKITRLSLFLSPGKKEKGGFADDLGSAL